MRGTMGAGQKMSKSILRTLTVFCALGGCLAAQTAAPMQKADLIFTHGNIYTGIGDTASLGSTKRAEFIALRGDRILSGWPA